MNLEEFKEAVRREFGANLQNATPANVREFLDRLQQAEWKSSTSVPLVLNETATTYEEIIRDFFARVLDLPPEQAIILLWTVAIELSFAALESHYAEIFDKLFRET